MENNSSPPRVATGTPGLDEVLNGGLPSGHLYLLEGEPGTGKTTLAMQFLMEGVRAGERSMYVSLSETERELRAVAESHGWDLTGVDIFELPAGYTKPDEQYTVFHASEVELADITKAILERVEETEPQRVVLDSLSEVRLLAGDALRYRRQILSLKQFFADRNCTVLLLEDRTATKRDLDVASISHGVVSLEQLTRQYGAERRRIRIAKMRGLAFRGGFHDYAILTGGLRIYPRLVAAEHRNGHKSGIAQSGIAALDTLLGGGIEFGTSTLILGPAGCGKSTIACRYVAAAAERGERGAIYTFDENPPTLLQRAAAIGANLYPHVESGRVKVQQVDPAELTPGEFIYRVRQEVEENKASIIVIDSVNGFMNAMPGEETLAMQLHELLSFLNQRGVVSLMVMAQYGILGHGMVTPADISYLADIVVLLRYFEAQGAVRQAISVVKKRSGSHERLIREFQLRPGEICVGPPLSEFHGILTGTPQYVGSLDPLMRSGAPSES
jgi:circadian clock protein KaiC